MIAKDSRTESLITKVFAHWPLQAAMADRFLYYRYLLARVGSLLLHTNPILVSHENLVCSGIVLQSPDDFIFQENRKSRETLLLTDWQKSTTTWQPAHPRKQKQLLFTCHEPVCSQFCAPLPMELSWFLQPGVKEQRELTSSLKVTGWLGSKPNRLRMLFSAVAAAAWKLCIALLPN